MSAGPPPVDPLVLFGVCVSWVGVMTLWWMQRDEVRRSYGPRRKWGRK